MKLARIIIGLAESKAVGFSFHMESSNHGYDNVVVRVRPTAVDTSDGLLDPGDYEVIAQIPYPRALKHGVSNSDLRKLDPSNVRGIILADTPDNVQYQEPKVGGSWTCYGGYASHNRVLDIKASTRPIIAHEQVLAAAKLQAADQQAERLLAAIAARQPIELLQPPFPHVAGEDDSQGLSV